MGERVGSGKKFRGLERRLQKSGAKNPAALAAYIGRKKYGTERFTALAEAGKRRVEAAPELRRRARV